MMILILERAYILRRLSLHLTLIFLLNPLVITTFVAESLDMGLCHYRGDVYNGFFTKHNTTVLFKDRLLVQTVLYHTPGKNKECRRVVASIRHELLDVDDVDVWDGDKLLVPSLPATGLRGCNIIDVHYTLMLKATADAQAKLELVLPVEVTIGTEPLKAVVEAHTDDVMEPLSPVTSQPNSVSLTTFKSNITTQPTIPATKRGTPPPVPPKPDPTISTPLRSPMYARYDSDNDSVRNVCL